jgi:hypothetical protein
MATGPARRFLGCIYRVGRTRHETSALTHKHSRRSDVSESKKSLPALPLDALRSLDLRNRPTAAGLIYQAAR